VPQTPVSWYTNEPNWWPANPNGSPWNFTFNLSWGSSSGGRSYWQGSGSARTGTLPRLSDGVPGFDWATSGSANSGDQVAKNLILGTETVLTGGYGHKMKESWENGEYGWAAGNLLMGTAYGVMNALSLGQLGAANATAQMTAREAALLSSEGTGALVWNGMKATQEVWPGTVIPRSFELLAGRTNLWVNGNATKHMAEYATSLMNNGMTPEAVSMASQAQLKSLQAAVAKATQGGIPFNKLVNVGGWELRFSQRVTDKLPVLMHALQKN
jgi:hypothetical protein